MVGQHSLLRNRLGYLLAGCKEFFNGFDSGAGLVKLPLFALGIIVSIFYAPFILIGGTLFAILFVARAIHEEKINIRKEQEKIAQHNKLEQELLLLESQLIATLKKTLAPDSKNTHELLWSYNPAFNERYKLLAYKNIVAKETTCEILLRYLLRDYLDALGPHLDLYRKSNGKLPKENKILRLVQQVVGVPLHHPEFNAKLAPVFGDDEELKSRFFKFAGAAQNVSDSENKEQTRWEKFKAFLKNSKTLRSLGRRIVDFISDFGTGAGITAGLLSLFGVLVATAPLSWPIIVAVIASGLIFAGLNLAYNAYVQKKRNTHIKLLEKNISEKEIKLAIAKRHLKVHTKLPGKLALMQQENNLFQHEHNARDFKETPAKISPLTYARMTLGIMGQVISAVSLGLIVGVGLAWLGTLLFPALPFVLPSLIAGKGMALYYVVRSIKTEIKSAKAQITKIQEVELAKQQLQHKYQDRFNLSSDFSKTNQMLLQETLEHYLNFIQECNENKKQTKYDNQEKIFTLIEDCAGIKRGQDKNGKNCEIGNNEFYDALAHYLTMGSTDPRRTHELVSRFKQLHHPHSAPVDVHNPAVNKKDSKLKIVGSFLKEHSFSFLGALSIGILVPAFLIGPQAAIIGIIASVIVAAYVVHRVTNWYSQKYNTKLDQDKMKVALIERKYKLIDKMSEPGSKPQPDIVSQKACADNQDMSYRSIRKHTSNKSREQSMPVLQDTNNHSLPVYQP